MPVDPRNNRNLPAGGAIAKLLDRLWQRQRLEALAAIRHDGIPSFGHWNRVLADLVRPYLLHYAGDGGHDAVARIRKVLKRGRGQKAFGLPPVDPLPIQIPDFDLFNPHILTAIEQAALQFAATVNAVSAQAVAQAREATRRALAESFTVGESQAKLVERIDAIFQDRARSKVIARTEASRMVHAGQVLAAKQTGIVSGKKWLASAGSCGKCEALDGKVVGLDEPFVVDMSDGAYAVKMHPPYHPNCRCTILEEINWDLVRGSQAA